MKSKRVWLTLIVLAIAGAVFWNLEQQRGRPPQVTFARVARESISSLVSTNGKVEPVESGVARAERSGAVKKILVQRGQRVEIGQTLVELDSSDAQAELKTAEARQAAIRAEMQVLSQGGRAADRAVIDTAIDKAKLELKIAQDQYASSVRLRDKKAGTEIEVRTAKEAVDRAQAQIQALQQQRASLVTPSDHSGAEARLDEAKTAAQLAEARIRMSVVRSPIAGTVYQFDLKPGAYLSAGDLVASIGRLDHVHVKVYVDEPDLGRVMKGMPVTITWDALPGRQWKGTVDRTPNEIVTMGARQVGEVTCNIENPDMDLLPGTNVNAVIVSETVENAVTIPKEAVRREQGKTGVYVLEGDHIRWRTITQGVNNTTRTQVKELKDGDAVALPSEKPLKDGALVEPVLQ
ncbi:MAG: efflux RND transporter periplasmic adaptor subunit [Acidobacteriia bacterium]|nr:efflux RND transporter periplasmic adaptor subunit [Terriglobia bacterium]